MRILGYFTYILALGVAAVEGQGYGPDPSGVPSDFLCGWRSLAYNYSVKLRPDAAVKVYDALEYGRYCPGVPRPVNPPTVWPPHGPVPSSGNTLYVDSIKGNDANSGSEADPLKTIQVAVNRKPTNIILRAGIHYLESAVSITEANNGLTIMNYPSEEAWVSGGVPLEGLEWSKVNGNIYKATLKQKLPKIPGLRFNGARYWPARYPNADPETTAWPTGYLTSAEGDWLPPKISPTPNPAVIVNVESPSRSWDADFTNYSGGVGGTCSIYDPPFSFWCASKFPDGCGGCFTWNIPSGLRTSVLPSFPSLAEPSSTALMNAWRQAHWANWQFEIDNVTVSDGNSTIHFGKGGFQGARGGPGSDWYISNVMEALDAPGEYFYNEQDGTLYIYSNDTQGGPPSSSDSIVAVVGQTLLNVKGSSMDSPVRNLTIFGVGFRDTAPTMLEPHGVPSGGDWALERIGAIYLENTETTVISTSVMSRIGGNGVMVSKYNRNTTVFKNEFAWMGGSAVAAWGWTDEISDNGTKGYDGTAGDFPRYTVIANNLFREIGVWEKQSSAFFQAKTAESMIIDNVVFNLARAGVNFNDGFGGGDVVDRNVLFNTCRESSDHGPINSWDRQPYLTTVRTGEPDFQMAWRTVQHNIVIANYGGSKEVDNDDGSLFYQIHDNFMAYGWSQKFKCGGIVSHNNLKAFVSSGGYFDAGCALTPSHYYPNTWHNDTLIVLGTQNFFYRDCWGTSNGHDYDRTQVYNNTLYTQPPCTPYVTCNGSNIPLKTFQEPGNDPGTVTFQTIPESRTILEWAVDTLGTW